MKYYFQYFAALISVAISFAITANSNKTTIKKKESPLFRIRTKRAIREQLKDLTSRFIRQRIFFLPFQWIIKIENSHHLMYSEYPKGYLE